MFLWLITHTWRGDGRRKVVTGSSKGYEEYEAIQVLLPSGHPPPAALKIKMAVGLSIADDDLVVSLALVSMN